MWRRTRCAFAKGVNAGHVVVVIDLPELRRDGGLRDRDGQEGLAPDARTRLHDNGQPSAAGTRHTRPREGRTRAEGTQPPTPPPSAQDTPRPHLQVHLGPHAHLLPPPPPP